MFIYFYKFHYEFNKNNYIFFFFALLNWKINFSGFFFNIWDKHPNVFSLLKMVINDKVVSFLLFFKNLCTPLREIHTHAHNEDKFILIF